MVLPFSALLLLIATGTVLFEKFWHEWYKTISVALGVFVFLYYLIYVGDYVIPVESLAEYISFISLLTVLFVASGGIFVFVDVESKPIVNIVFLFIGAILANFIGTTGASVLLIRPFMRINRYRLKPYHVVFFILMISNCAGLLTPIGDPPLFLGFLKGVPFAWTIKNLFTEWLLVIGYLLIVFYFFDKKNRQLDDVDISEHYTGKIIISGKRNFIWLTIAIISVFLDPHLLDFIPYIEFHGKKISFLREIIQLSCAFVCFIYANKKAYRSNDFKFEPILEVAFLFFGIFLTMLPALQLLEHFVHVSGEKLHITPGLIFWSTGFFSSFLDNAPTYLNVFAVILSKENYSINSFADVRSFMEHGNLVYLAAVSVGSVFFGAMTYIGNGPNFIVKSIAEHGGVKMPSFGKYISHFSLPILMPILILVWIIFYLI